MAGRDGRRRNEMIGGSMDSSARKVAVGFAALRIGYAVGLLAAPERVARAWVGADARSPGGAVALRGLGGRDLVLSVGVAACAWAGRDARPWLAACAASDAVDLTATLYGARLVAARARPSRARGAGRRLRRSRRGAGNARRPAGLALPPTLSGCAARRSAGPCPCRTGPRCPARRHVTPARPWSSRRSCRPRHRAHRRSGGRCWRSGRPSPCWPPRAAAPRTARRP